MRRQIQPLNERPSRYMKPHLGKGKELCDLLRKELGIPENVRWFEVRFALDDAVKVTCEYRPKDGGQ